MRKKTVMFGIKLSEDERRQLLSFSEKVETTGAKLLRQMIAMIVSFDAETWRTIQGIARAENVAIATLFKNCIMKWLIKVDETIKLTGNPDPDDLLVFAKNLDGSPVDFETLERARVREKLESEIAKNIIETKEAHNIPLEPWEHDLLIRRRQGRTWYESDEYKEFQRQGQAVKQAQEKYHLKRPKIFWESSEGKASHDREVGI